MISCSHAKVAFARHLENVMAFGLFRKRAVTSIEAVVIPKTTPAPIIAELPAAPDADSAQEILELLELELGAMIRQLDRAANSVAGGAEATAPTAHRCTDEPHQRGA